GTSAELQLVPRPIAEVMKAAHELRQPVKRLDLAVPENLAKFRAVMDEARRIFDDAWARSPDWQGGLAEGRAYQAGPAHRYTDLGPFLRRAGTPLARQAQSYVVSEGIASGVEHLVAIDDEGKAVGHVRGNEK